MQASQLAESRDLHVYDAVHVPLSRACTVFGNNCRRSRRYHNPIVECRRHGQRRHVRRTGVATCARRAPPSLSRAMAKSFDAAVWWCSQPFKPARAQSPTTLTHTRGPALRDDLGRWDAVPSRKMVCNRGLARVLGGSGCSNCACGRETHTPSASVHLHSVVAAAHPVQLARLVILLWRGCYYHAAQILHFWRPVAS